MHLLSLEQVVGLDGPECEGEDTVEKESIHDGIEMDLVTHDANKFFGLMLKKNGYVLEQLLSPLVVHTTPEHEELKAIAKDCITKFHEREYERLVAELEAAMEKSSLPKQATGRAALNDLLVRLRLQTEGVDA